MPRRIIYLVVCLVVLGMAAAQLGMSQGKTSEGAPAQKPARSASPQSAPAPAVDRAELEAMKLDLQRMQVILNQMRVNLGLATTTTTPLKHQFELDIDMWQIALQQMERRIQKMESQGNR